MLQQLGTIKCGACEPKFEHCDVGVKLLGKPCECICHKTMEKQTWQEEFDKQFKKFEYYDARDIKVKQFISDLLAKQESQIRADERAFIIKIIEDNYKGAFTDDAGNNCWYVDDLVKIIHQLKGK